LNYFTGKADKAVAHRQCARSADALKSDEGKYSLYHLNDELFVLIHSQKRTIGFVPNVSPTTWFPNLSQGSLKKFLTPLRDEYHETELQAIYCHHNAP
jgi:hypothetical protein